jgi:hypothetical protein
VVIGVRSDTVKYSGKPKVGDTITVYYKPFKQFRFDPGFDAIKIEVIAAGGSKK